ncbi:phosphodiester glycosidase family protein [Lactococcus insecticola]|uniref:Exopolysaccharide biosynthesis protein n=1 Tax=Pseudolactococcus insecticola TaxID=2709158 RepID=A0A6A0B4K8_9LACT|nr:phosphodiester glycosidase family protein [Lactococcus insecticola]GFH40290.1 exopolysaccharide biosynthesis protein [Lactococcus insecticola]
MAKKTTRSRHQENKNTKFGKTGLVIVGLILIIACISAFVLLTQSKTTHSTASNPIKTNTSNTIVSSSKVAIASAPEVKDTGEAGWVQVKSKEKLDKFTDLSVEGVTIYRANNPKVLKTAAAQIPGTYTMQDMIDKYPNTLIMNTSGFDMATGQIVGFQINNGKLFSNWSNTAYGSAAFVINKNGSATGYDLHTPATEILEKGAEQSYGFGSILIKNGVTLPDDGSVNWMIHSYIGNDAANNIYLIISDTSVGYEGTMAAVADLKLQNLVVLDGGGSSQMSLNGQTIFASQDGRPVADFIVLK